MKAQRHAVELGLKEDQNLLDMFRHTSGEKDISMHATHINITLHGIRYCMDCIRYGIGWIVNKHGEGHSFL